MSGNSGMHALDGGAPSARRLPLLWFAYALTNSLSTIGFAVFATLGLHVAVLVAPMAAGLAVYCGRRAWREFRAQYDARDGAS